MWWRRVPGGVWTPSLRLAAAARVGQSFAGAAAEAKAEPSRATMGKRKQVKVEAPVDSASESSGDESSQDEFELEDNEIGLGGGDVSESEIDVRLPTIDRQG